MTGSQIIDYQPITILGGAVFLGYTIMATTYWSDAAKLFGEAKTLSEGKDRDKVQYKAKKAEIIFRISTGMMILSVVLVALPVYVPSVTLAIVCKWLLLLPLAGILIMSLRYMAGKYFIPLK